MKTFHLDRRQKSLLLYVEDCAVNKYFQLEITHVRAEEWQQLDKWSKGKVPLVVIKGTTVIPTTKGWKIAHALRLERAARALEIIQKEKTV
jgi:hypothetical protein